MFFFWFPSSCSVFVVMFLYVLFLCFRLVFLSFCIYNRKNTYKNKKKLKTIRKTCYKKRNIYIYIYIYISQPEPKRYLFAVGSELDILYFCFSVFLRVVLIVFCFFLFVLCFRLVFLSFCIYNRKKHV